MSDTTPTADITGTTPTIPRRYSESEAAEYLGVSQRTLQDWRLRGSGGPAYFKLGSARTARIVYDAAELADYMDRHRIEPKEAA